MKGLNLFEKSDKRQVKTTNIKDSVNNQDMEFAFFSFQINSVGVTLAGILVVIIIFILFKNVSVQCLKPTWRKLCNSANTTILRPPVYGGAEDAVIIMPRAS